MKYYSDVLHKLFESPQACLRAELELEQELNLQCTTYNVEKELGLQYLQKELKEIIKYHKALKSNMMVI